MHDIDPTDAGSGSGPRRQRSRAEFGPQRRAELSRLRVAMGFIPVKDATPRLIDDRYEIVRPLGSGGMGVVYLARDREFDDSEVALKLVRDSYLREVPSAPARLRREANQMAKLRSHPNIVTVLDVGPEGGSTYLTMERVTGMDLRRWTWTTTPGRRDTLAAYLGAAAGLQAAHDIGVVHGDFKPDNVLIDEAGVSKVTDFGIATLVNEAADAEPGRALSTNRGTLAYVAPEQLAGEQPDARSDQFSFCVALWEALAGALPYDWREAESQKIALAGPPARPEQLPRWLRRLLQTGMAARRSDRHTNMRGLITQLERGLARPQRVRRAAATSVAIGAALIVGIGLRAIFDPDAPSCETFVAQVDARWTPEIRAALEARGRELDVDVGWTIAELDVLARRWAGAARETCVGDQAPSSSGPRAACLVAWLGPYEAAIDLLVDRGDRKTLSRAPDLLAGLDTLEASTCVIPPLPADPDLRKHVLDARAAARVDAHEQGRAASARALERARVLAGERTYTFEQALAHVAQAEVLSHDHELELASEHFALAEEHASGVGHQQALLETRVLWAWTLAHTDEHADADAGLERLRQATPLFHLTATPDLAQLRGQGLEVRALLERRLGNFSEAARGYQTAIEFYTETDNAVLTARALIGAGNLEHERGDYAAAEALLRDAAELLDAQGLPPSYRVIQLNANYNLAVAIYSGADPSSPGYSDKVDASLRWLDAVITQAPPPLHLDALATACQISAENGRRTHLRRYVSQARAALDAHESAPNPNAVLLQIELSALLVLDDERARTTIAAQLEREDLDLELRVGLIMTWIEHLEDGGRTREAAAAFARYSQDPKLATVEQFYDWVAERPTESAN